MTWLLMSSPALAGWDLTDAGAENPGPPVVIVCTPGVPGEAYLPWVEGFEELGLDAWTLELPPKNQTAEQAADELATALAEIQDDYAIAAHGYAGVLVLLAAPSATRMALVGTPLAAQVATPRLRDPGGVVSQGMPFEDDLLGGLPGEPYSGQLGTAYATWAEAFPEYAPPTVHTLVVASNIDPIAPPEITRLPSLGWPDREWHRAGMLGVAEQDLTHAELLTHPRTIRMIGRFLGEES